MAKKQTSFADKAAKLGKEAGAVYVKYVKSVKSEKTGQWRFNEQMVRTNKSESLDAALKRINDADNLTDIDLSEFLDQSNKNETSDIDRIENKESTNTSEKNIVDASLSNEKADSDTDQLDTGKKETEETEEASIDQSEEE